MAKISYLDRPGAVIGEGISKEEFEGMTVEQLREAVIRGGYSIFRRHDGSYDMSDDKGDAYMPDGYNTGGTMKLDPEYEAGPSDEARRLGQRAIVDVGLFGKIDAVLTKHAGAEHLEGQLPCIEALERDAARTK